MKIKKADTNWARIYMAGDMEITKQVCRAYCFNIGLCVTLTKTDYIYAGGLEGGFIVELINYPRFSIAYEELLRKVERLAEELMDANYQKSYTIMTSKETFWYSRREE